MFRLVLSLFATLGLAVCLVHGQTNYCDVALCGNAAHIACNNTGAWASRCPTSPAPVLIEMNENLRLLVLRLHNRRRNFLAQGLVGNLPSGRRMATMRWSPEMANLTALNVRQCQLKRDACRNTNKFNPSGQNMGQIIYGGAVNSRTTEDLVTAIITSWWRENQYVTPAMIARVPQNWTGPVIHQFMLMARQRNSAVGCSIGRFEQAEGHVFRLVCNYATAVRRGLAVYARGLTAAGCTTGTNINYPGLCSVAEIYP